MNHCIYVLIASSSLFNASDSIFKSLRFFSVPVGFFTDTKKCQLIALTFYFSIGKKTTTSRPSTAPGARLTSNRKSFGRSSTEADKPTRQSQPSLESGLLSIKRIKPNLNNDNNASKLPVKKNSRNSLGSATYRVPDELCKDLGQSRPSTATAVSHAPKNLQANNRPKSAVAGSKRITRSMAAQFKKS